MEGNIPENILTNLKKATADSMVLGEPVILQGISLVPVISITTTYGGLNSNVGGGSIKLDPVAIVTVREGEVNIFSLHRNNSVQKLASLLPENFCQKFNDQMHQELQD